MIAWNERRTHYNRDYYDGEATGPYRAGWWTDSIAWEPKARIIQAAFTPDSVLVCGCAKGSLVKYLLDIHVDAIGFDLSEYAIMTTPFPEIQNRLLLHDLATEPLPFRDKRFDVSVAIDFFEHQDDEHIQFVCREIGRVTRKEIFIRQPFTDLSTVADLKALYMAVAERPHSERMLYMKKLGTKQLFPDKDNIEHPNTLSRENLKKLFPEFGECGLPSRFYDMDRPEEPVFPFFDTMVLERIV